MPIIRTNEPRSAEKVSRDDLPDVRQERHHDDYDLLIGGCRIYIIDEHEWFDPHTSSKYDGPGGISRHAYCGPSVVSSVDSGGALRCDEFYVNDPTIWNHVQKFIVFKETDCCCCIYLLFWQTAIS